MAVFDPAINKVRTYVDGQEGMIDYLNYDTGTNPLRIGGAITGSRWFDGIMDEVRVYGTALPAAEVSSLYQENLGDAEFALSITPSIEFTRQSPLQFDVRFNKDVADLVQGDFTVTGGQATSLTTVNASTYHLEVNASSDPSTVKVSLPAGSAHEPDGHPNPCLLYTSDAADE